MKRYEVNFIAYEVLETEYDGKGYTHIGYFSNYADAIKAKDQTDWPRTVKELKFQQSWNVYESYDEYDPLLKAKRKEEALAKLTSEERELLGLL